MLQLLRGEAHNQDLPPVDDQMDDGLAQELWAYPLSFTVAASMTTTRTIRMSVSADLAAVGFPFFHNCI